MKQTAGPEQGVLASPEGIPSALDQGLPDPDEILPNLTPRARIYVGAYWRVLGAMLATHRDEVVEVIQLVAEGGLAEVTDAPGLETYFALCQALAVAGLHNRVPSATMEVLAVALWQTFRRALEEDAAKLSARAAALLDDDSNEVFVSVASYWEIVLKYDRNRLALPCPPDEWARSTP